MPAPRRSTVTPRPWRGGSVKTRPDEIHVRELQRKIRLPGLKTAEDIHAAAAVLVEAGWLTPPPRGQRQKRAGAAYRVKEVLWGLLDAPEREKPL
jgi:hypothetical protein